MTDEAVVSVPVSNQTQILAEVAKEACVVQVHDSMFLPSNVYIHRQPVIC